MPRVIEITDFLAPELDVYARATENQLVNRADPSNALFIAESPLVIGRALDAGCVPVSFLMEPQHITGKGAEILTRCDPDIPVYTAPLDVLTQLTGFHLTRGMLCAMRRPPLPTLDEVCAGARRIAVLENVMNPTNLGAIFRCAAALGMDAVLLTSAGSDPLYRRASRVSMGNVFLVPWTYLPEGDWTALLRQRGFTTVAMALREDSLRLDDPRLLAAEKLAVVLGTEGDGLADGTIAGSVVNILEEIRRLMSFGIPEETAIKCSTINPAKAARMDDVVGSISVGKYADLLVLNEDYTPAMVYRDGIRQAI